MALALKLWADPRSTCSRKALIALEETVRSMNSERERWVR